MPEDPPRKATALRYDRAGAAGGEGAPRVVAKGHGPIAERIVERAKEAGVPIREDAALVSALAALDLDAEIPVELYAAVAETLAWAYALDARAQGRA